MELEASAISTTAATTLLEELRKRMCSTKPGEGMPALLRHRVVRVVAVVEPMS
jgi:hypothetical protein